MVRSLADRTFQRRLPPCAPRGSRCFARARPKNWRRTDGRWWSSPRRRRRSRFCCARRVFRTLTTNVRGFDTNNKQENKTRKVEEIMVDSCCMMTRKLANVDKICQISVNLALLRLGAENRRRYRGPRPASARWRCSRCRGAPRSRSPARRGRRGSPPGLVEVRFASHRLSHVLIRSEFVRLLSDFWQNPDGILTELGQ